MKKKITIFPLILALSLSLCACNSGEDNSKNNTSNNTQPTTTESNIDFTQTSSDMFSDRDTDASYENAVKIELLDTTASCDSDLVSIKDGTITITKAGTYYLSGTLNNGMVLVDTGENEKVQLVLGGVNITNSTSSPLYIRSAEKVFVTLVDGTENTLANAGTFEAIDDNNINAAIYSKQDLTFNGGGMLTVTSPAGHGISCKDDLVFTDGSYVITSASHALDANDSVRIKDGVFTLYAGKDGIHVENSDDTEKGFLYISDGAFSITAEGDGMDAGYYMQIEGGSMTMLCGGGYENGDKQSSENFGNMGGFGPGGERPDGTNRPGRRTTDTTSDATTSDASGSTDSASTEGTSMKGLKSDSSMYISGGTFTIDSADDALHSNQSLTICSGTFTIASGDDGIHAENTLDIKNGTISITQSYEGLEALDIVIAGGDIDMQSTDDGINAAGGTDGSGMGGRDEMFEQPGAKKGGFGPGGMSANSNGSLTISGGDIFMYAKGDGLDANGSIKITGGNVIVTGPTQGDTAILDYDTSATMEGGTFIGVGSSSMAQSFSDGTQGTIAVKATASGNTIIRVVDSSNNEIISYTPTTDYACVIISTPQLEKGQTYTLYVGEQSGSFEAQ